MSDFRAVGKEDEDLGQGSQALVPVWAGRELVAGMSELPDIVHRAGQAAVSAAEEFFDGAIRNDTRRAYRHAVNQFLAWAEELGLELVRIAPRDVGQYLTSLVKKTGIATRKQHLAALRHFFDGLVTRHAIILNPALSVRSERYAVVEGKTPEISIPQARALLGSINVLTVVGQHDRAILAIMIYTASRAGAVASLKRGSFYRQGGLATTSARTTGL